MSWKRSILFGVLLTVLVATFSASPVFGGHNPNHGKGKGGVLTGTLNVTAAIAPEPDGRPHLHILVTHDDVGPVKAAKVVGTVTDVLDGRVVADLRGTTDRDGVAHFENKRKATGSPPPGTYSIDATATKDEASGGCTGCVVVTVEG